jgi:hypothetical protein
MAYDCKGKKNGKKNRKSDKSKSDKSKSRKLESLKSPTLLVNNVFAKSARAMRKVHVVQNYDNDILEGLVVTNPPPPKP